ncbi:hypothetical protein [Streptomyces gardneri]|uniref:hypothetical protein n=1 Tax=Streptomyces gardneri TaxID=66892 RepID=UPI003690B8BF
MSGVLSSVVSPVDADSADAARPPAATSPIPARYHRALLTIMATSGVVTVWASCTWMSLHLHVDPLLHKVALFAHLASLILGFGAVLAIDYYGLLWLLGRRSLPDTLERAANGVHATALHHRLTDLGHRNPTTGSLVRAGASAVVSQMSWWGAVVIGFLNGRH